MPVVLVVVVSELLRDAVQDLQCSSRATKPNQIGTKTPKQF